MTRITKSETSQLKPNMQIGYGQQKLFFYLSPHPFVFTGATMTSSLTQEYNQHLTLRSSFSTTGGSSTHFSKRAGQRSAKTTALGPNQSG